MTSPPISDAHAILFDMDDTLINWRQAEHAAIGDLVRLHLGPAGHAEERVRTVYADVMAENLRAWRATQKWWYIADRLKLLVQRLEADVSHDLLADAFKAQVQTHLALLPGAEAALLAARVGRRTALLTNGPSLVQRPKIERMRLAPHFDFVGVTGEIGHWKPSPEAFQHVLRQLGVAPQQAVMVGDSLDFDIIPAKALGMRTVWIDPDLGSHASADLVIATPGALVPHLGRAIA